MSGREEGVQRGGMAGDVEAGEGVMAQSSTGDWQGKTREHGGWLGSAL